MKQVKFAFNKTKTNLAVRLTFIADSEDSESYRHPHKPQSK